ncbi:MAG: outer membrane beta-barrel protein [Pseudolabrys sp.]|nr:outer membrane beta-barrel protein [Pseudolabrys sp.]
MKFSRVGNLFCVAVVVAGLAFVKPAAAYTIIGGISDGGDHRYGLRGGQVVSTMAIIAMMMHNFLPNNEPPPMLYAPENKALNPAFDAMAKATDADQAMAAAPGYYKARPLARPDWSGAYVGGSIGWGNASTKWTDTFGDLAGVPGNSLRVNPDGVFGSVLAGYNWQRGAFVYGLEGEFTWSGIDGDTTLSLPPATGTFDSRARWIASVTGRVGLVGRDPFTGRSMLSYVKGGAAWAEFNNSFVLNGAIGPFNFGTQNNTAAGWTVGLGVEVLLGGGWTGRLESTYYDFGSKRFDFFLPAFGPARFDTDLSVLTTKVGFSYKFGGL